MRRAAFILSLAMIALPARAHPLIQDALDVVIAPDLVSITAHVSPEELTVTGDRAAHPAYVLQHLRIQADGQFLQGREKSPPASTSPTATYRYEFPLSRPPAVVRLTQNLLVDHPPWSVSCVVRIRQNDQTQFESALLTTEGTAEFGCTWPAGSQPSKSPAPETSAPQLRPTFRAYTLHGITHILTGYDHLLFVTALVLAAVTLLDLVKVVTAFTLAHTLTLVLSVFNIVTLTEHIVEPMISASIIFVALQNVFQPRASRGRWRIAIAFAFGLFHGLGFAGGLRDAMMDLPRMTLWVALIAFSLGVELGHQAIVLPSFFALRAVSPMKDGKIGPLRSGVIRWGSSAIALGGIYFLLQSFRR